MSEANLVAEVLVEGERCLRRMRALRDELAKGGEIPSMKRSAARRASLDLSRALSAFRNHEAQERAREYREAMEKRADAALTR